MNKLYAVPFWDVGCPSFVSDYIVYFASAEDIDRFAKACHNSESHEEFLSGYKEYKNGNTNAIINIAYCDLPFAEPVAVIGKSEETMKNTQWEILNIWDCPYMFKADELHRELVWLKHKERWLRTAKYKIKGLQMSDESDSFEPISFLMGNAEVIVFENDCSTDCYTLFFMPERFFNSEEECRIDMASPQFAPENDLSSFCFEIIADG